MRTNERLSEELARLRDALGRLMLIRELEKAGFDRDKIREELGL